MGCYTGNFQKSAAGCCLCVARGDSFIPWHGVVAVMAEKHMNVCQRGL
jgi:hypothetical protein